MKYAKLGLLAPLALLCFLPGTPARTLPKEPHAAFRQIPLTSVEFYLTIKGTKQGMFQGNDRHNRIPGLGYEFQVTTPHDAATGQASGKRQWKPITITKEWGAASPQILTALATNELLPAVQLQFFKANADGADYLDHVITLTDATIVDVHHHPETGLRDGSSDKHQLEEVSFTFRKIEVDDKVDKTSFVDDWSNGKQ